MNFSSQLKIDLSNFFHDDVFKDLNVYWMEDGDYLLISITAMDLELKNEIDILREEIRKESSQNLIEKLQDISFGDIKSLYIEKKILEDKGISNDEDLIEYILTLL